MQIGILGGGISGLAAAYFIRRRLPHAQIHLFEKSSLWGGVIDEEKESFFFEKGPRTFSSLRHKALLSLAEELGLEILYTSPSSLNRFVLWKKKLCAFPRSLFQMLFSKLGWVMIAALGRDARTPLLESEETVGAFARRRFGRLAAELFFDPLTKGIFGAPMDLLSVNAAFPRLKEDKLIDLFFAASAPDRLFSIQGGVSQLCKALVEKTRLQLHLDTAIHAIEGKSIETSQGPFTFDALCCALPASALKEIDSPLHSLFATLPLNSLSLVHVAFKEGVELPLGYGYLIPSIEEEGSLLGAMFDSRQFPQQNYFEGESRITYLLNTLDEKEAVQEVLSALKRHLGISKVPDFIQFNPYPEALPIYPIGHKLWCETLEATSDFPLVGNYLDGVSVNACIERAEKISKRFSITP